MLLLIIKLLLAHVIGDFFLQPRKWVNDKKNKKFKSKWLYIHTGIHFALMLVLVWDLKLTGWLLIIAMLHFAIDALKMMLQTIKNERWVFFADQFLHVATIVLISFIYFSIDLNENVALFKFTALHFLILLCVLFLTIPASIIMKVIFSKWNIEKISKDNKSLKDAGKYIGMLERLLVFTFVVIGQWPAVGFLITAKSVFRFGDLTNSNDRKLTEYILIGTLVSFVLAIAIGLLFKFTSLYV